jgi:hypothetical protein
MRTIFILLFLRFSCWNINAQAIHTLISNKWYFSQSDTLFFSQAHIKANKVRHLKEYRTDKKYTDSVLLASEYFFDSFGSIIKSKTYDIHGHPSVTEFKIAPNGKMAESWVSDQNGAMVKTTENIYDGDLLIRQISYYGHGHTTSIEFIYRTDGLLSCIQYIGSEGLKGATTTFAYDSLNRIVSEITKNAGDSLGYCYFYKYDKSGRKYFTEYREANQGWTERVDYSRSTLNSLVKRIYSGDKLNEIIAQKNNGQGQITELITDRRMSTKRRKKNNMFCGYSGPPRYHKWIYEYDSNGNLICEKEYYSPTKKSEQTNYIFDSNGNLIGRKNKDSEWTYSYN